MKDQADRHQDCFRNPEAPNVVCRKTIAILQILDDVFNIGTGSIIAPETIRNGCMVIFNIQRVAIFFIKVFVCEDSQLLACGFGTLLIS